MGRRALPANELRSCNLAVRMLPSLMAQIESEIEGRLCNKSELVLGLIEVALGEKLGPRVVEAIEAAKVHRQGSASRSDLVKQLRSVETERRRLCMVLDSLDGAEAQPSPRSRVISIATSLEATGSSPAPSDPDETKVQQ